MFCVLANCQSDRQDFCRQGFGGRGGAYEFWCLDNLSMSVQLMPLSGQYEAFGLRAINHVAYWPSEIFFRPGVSRFDWYEMIRIRSGSS